MCITENTDYNAVSLQAENIIPKDVVINELKQRFKRIVIIYDNDYTKDTNWGLRFSTNLSEKIDIKYGLIQVKYKSKDCSDLYKNHNKDTLLHELNRIIETIDLPF